MKSYKKIVVCIKSSLYKYYSNKHDLSVTVSFFQEEEVSAQMVAPSFYGGAPLMYGYEDNDDDFGVLLALLLLASRNRGSNGYGGNGYCCNSCNNVRTVPVPFPIPFPTNNPIIRQSVTDDDDEPSNSSPPATITIETENDDETTNEANVNSAPNNIATANSTSTSNASGTSAASNSNAATS